MQFVKYNLAYVKNTTGMCIKTDYLQKTLLMSSMQQVTFNLMQFTSWA